MKIFTVILLSFLSVLFVLPLQAQFDNLIPDPSGENLIECPEHLGGYAEDGNGIGRYVPAWTTMRETPDYFHSCTVQPLLGWNNSLGYQIPRSGEGYFGAIAFDPSVPNYREIFGTTFTESLTIGQEYRVTFHTVMAYKKNTPPGEGNITGMASDNLGFLLLTENSVLSLAEAPLPNRATFRVESALTDTANWTEYSYEFIADSTYTAIAFGNFFEDDSTEVFSPYDDEITLAYYFFDDFCVTHVDNDCSYILSDEIEEMSDATIQVYPNPTNSGFTIKSVDLINRLTIYDIEGRTVTKLNNVNSNQFHLDESLRPGIYLIEIEGERSKMTKKLVVQP